MNKSSKEHFTNTKKHLGQNWLIDQNAINNFIDFCDIRQGDNVLEIGIGKGAITVPLLERANKVVTVEIDKALIQELAPQIQNSKFKILNIDFLQLDLSETIKKEQITTIVSALPYYITSPIIHKIIEEAKPSLNQVCLITQKEFAQKLIGKKNKRSYFTNLVEKYCQITPGKVIFSQSFYPVPKVDSMYFKLTFHSYPTGIYQVNEWKKFLHHAFRMPRKKLNKSFDNNELLTLGIDENLRPENLTIKQLEQLSNRATTE